jgi:spermidine/putrescine transport system substrate-binding protein
MGVTLSEMQHGTERGTTSARGSARRPRGDEHLTGAQRGTLAGWLKGVDEGRMSRREFVARATALGASVSGIGMALALAGCGSGDDEGTTASFDKTKPASISFYNWTEYTSPKVLKRFKQETGIDVDLSLYESNEELYASLKKGAVVYDVVIPESAWVSILAKANLIQPLDMSLIPNFDANVTTELFRSPPFDPGTDGVKYSVPYMFGTVGIAVRLDKIADPPTSWEILYDPKYKQQMSMLDGAHEILGPALFSLGYSPNTTSQSELDEATAKAVAQKKLVKIYDSTFMTDRMIAGLPLVECWDGDAILAMNKMGISKLRYLLPDEGYTVWMDGICVPTNAASPYGAHLFLNFLLDPANAAESANFIGYQPAVDAADPLITSLVQRAMRPTPEVIAKGTLGVDLGAFEDAFQAAYKKVQQA